MERLPMGATTTRRAKWKYPPPQPAPKILHLPPHRPTRKAPKPKASPSNSKLPTLHNETKGMMLVSLFDQERSFTRGVDPMVLVSPSDDEDMRRKRVVVEEEENRENSSVSLVEEEKWRFQAEILRAECNLSRMERDIAVKKMERTLKSTVQTLIYVRNICEGKNVMLILEEQIDKLSGKLEKLQKRSRVKDLEVEKCSNFDEQVCFLQRRHKKFEGFSEEEVCVKEIRQMAEASLSIRTSSEGDESFVSNGNNNVEFLRRKMERLSKGVLLERMEEDYGSMLSTTNSSVPSSASSSKRIDYSDLSLSSTQQSYKEKMSLEARVCSGNCKAIVQRIVKQVRAEMEQWSQMKEMLGQVRDEMEELQKCRDFWEDRALDSVYQIQSLQSVAKEWKRKAISSEAKANELQAQISVLHEEIERLQIERDRKTARARNTSINQEVQNETEKRVLVCRLKENHCADDDGCKAQSCTAAGLLPRRSPLREIGNMSALMKQHGEGIMPLFCLSRDPEM
ncbi:Myosin-related isoform 2 [Hibiscus syriacus]|uniref:Myosin-related isoform 2 n=1 Tax=Hibiscus syriacus TaxID=106335 RepID=A0A6A2YL58_HIBSY|nr:uncharacterized protein LOC120162079 isoform X2 [Hibiscus syriacus]KAE8678854.1 Myosin-related isoform 2 [Hibiscus syriacus]